MSAPEPLYTLLGDTTPPVGTGTPGHYQRLEVIGDVLAVHTAHGVITGVLLQIHDGGEPVQIALVLDPPQTWPSGLARGTRLWARGRLGQEKELHRRNLFYVEVAALAKTSWVFRTFGEAVVKVLALQTVTGHTSFRGIAPVNALKPRRPVKISSPKMTMTHNVLTRFAQARRVGSMRYTAGHPIPHLYPYWRAGSWMLRGCERSLASRPSCCSVSFRESADMAFSQEFPGLMPSWHRRRLARYTSQADRQTHPSLLL